MGLSHFPYGLSVYGSPILPGPGVVPNIPSGKNFSGRISTQYAGVLFVNADMGSDANDGLTPSTPLKNLDTAYNITVGGANEIIYVIGGSAAVSYSTKVASGGSGLVWSKNYTHCIGLAAPVGIGQRARITNGASTNLLTPLISVTGSGNMFQNLEFYNGGSDATKAAVCIAITGSRNAFINCQITGGGDATNAANAAMRSLTITGPGGENFFKHCYIGLDTLDRSGTATTEIELKTGTVRNLFEDCIISTYTSAGANFFVTIGADGIDRFAMFRNCIFMNAYTFSGGVILSDAFSLNAACGGLMVLDNPSIIGATATAATKTCLFFNNVPGSTTTGKDLVAGW